MTIQCVLTFLKLKQGDPMLYGRAGEEILYFRQFGFEAIVIPGISSAFAAPLLANIPVTQRGVAESLVICTGVGRKGKDVRLPGYERSRTLVVLMGVARLPQMLEALLEGESKIFYSQIDNIRWQIFPTNRDKLLLVVGCNVKGDAKESWWFKTPNKQTRDSVKCSITYIKCRF